MGNRNDWSTEQLEWAVEASNGILSAAAKLINTEFGPEDKVTRQNLYTWINNSDSTEAQDSMDLAEVLRKNLTLSNSNSVLRRDNKRALTATLAKGDTLQAIAQAIACTEPSWPMPYIPEIIGGKPITIELLFSDIQLGKLMNDYNTEVALRRVDEWAEVVMKRIQSYRNQGYQIDKIVLAVLGDIIESDKKHLNSGRACDIGTADQMKVGIEVLFRQVIKRLATVGSPLEVVMITGNHDHDGHGLNMFMPGREHLSWPLYHAVRMLTEAAGINASFYIPEGSFHVHDIYGTKVLYEHGTGVSSSGSAMKSHVGKRIDQLKEYITLFRMADKHNVCRFNNDRLVVNGAFFGDSRSGEEYSGIVGYDGEPAQLMFAHVHRKDNFRTTIFDSLSIQLGHVK